MPESLSIDESLVDNDDAYPISVTLRYLSQDETPSNPPSTTGSHIANGLFRSNLSADNTDSILSSASQDGVSKTETIRAKYVVGCDGAHSWTRRQIGSVMEGEQTDFVW
jgi:phenol 2-monooxygenase